MDTACMVLKVAPASPGRFTPSHHTNSNVGSVGGVGRGQVQTLNPAPTNLYVVCAGAAPERTSNRPAAQCHMLGTKWAMVAAAAKRVPLKGPSG